MAESAAWYQAVFDGGRGHQRTAIMCVVRSNKGDG